MRQQYGAKPQAQAGPVVYGVVVLDPAVARVSICVLVVACCACSSEVALVDGDAGAAPTEVVSDAGTIDAGTIDAETRPRFGRGLFEPHNVSFETARHVVPDDTAALLQEVWKAGQADFYEFTGEADTFYEIWTSKSGYSPNNVITLFDSDRQQLGENDRGSMWPGDGTDARLIARLPRTGKYFFRIEDRTTPQAAFDSPGFDLSFYRLRVRTLRANDPGIALAAPSGSSELLFKEVENPGFRVITVLGAFGPHTDDRFGFEGAEGSALVGHVLQLGAADGRITVSDSAGDAVAELQPASGIDEFNPPLGAGPYVLNVRGQADDVESYYAIDLLVMSDNPRERSEATNGVTSGAELLSFEGSGHKRAYTLSYLPPGDVDYYAFDAVPGAGASATCEGQSAGSGVRELRAELRDAADSLLVGATETATSNLRTDLYMFAEAGRYYLRLSSGTPQAEAAVQPWARCSIVMAAP